MSTKSFRHQFVVDRTTAMFVGLFLFVQFAVTRFAIQITSNGATADATQTGGVENSVYFVAIVILETIVVVTVWRWRSIVPSWIFTGIKWGVLISLAILSLWHTAVVHGTEYAAMLLAASIVLGPAIVWNDLYWVLHNALAIAICALVALLLGWTAEPRVVLGFLLLMTVWDTIAVWKSNWMRDLVIVAAGNKLPLFFILPARFQVDMDRLTDWMSTPEEEKPDDISAVLGLGDVALPAALVASCIFAFPESASLLVVGAVSIGGAISMAVLRMSLARGTMLPALPWITTGTTAGFVVGVAASSLTLLEVFVGV